MEKIKGEPPKRMMDLQEQVGQPLGNIKDQQEVWEPLN